VVAANKKTKHTSETISRDSRELFLMNRFCPILPSTKFTWRDVRHIILLTSPPLSLRNIQLTKNSDFIEKKQVIFADWMQFFTSFACLQNSIQRNQPLSAMTARMATERR
jgi:hypothetical protein